MSDVGVVLSEQPATVRGPDLAFVSHERMPSAPGPGFLRVPPDLAVEILSPSNRAQPIETKVHEYLAAGVRLVWVVDPRTRTVQTWHPPSGRRVLCHGDTLDGGDVLPGFRVPVADVWPLP